MQKQLSDIFKEMNDRNHNCTSDLEETQSQILDFDSLVSELLSIPNVNSS
jgi:hypothetical protein